MKLDYTIIGERLKKAQIRKNCNGRTISRTN